MARKQKHEEHENHERWLVSYADFITLLFAFFVVMYAISSVNEGKYRVLSDALVAAFRSSPKSLEPIQVGSLSKAPVISTAQEDHRKPAMARLPKMYISQTKSMEGQIREPLMDEKYTSGDDLVNIAEIADAVKQALQSLVDKGLITIKKNALWVEVAIRDSVLFPSGSARIQEEALPILQEVARILHDFPNPIRVEGFTDNVPINTIVYPSNWELSAARAASVVRLFADAGIDPARMVAQGYGEYRPVADNDTPEGRAKNRRVVIVVMADKQVAQLLGDRAEAAQKLFTVPAAGEEQTTPAAPAAPPPPPAPPEEGPAEAPLAAPRNGPDNMVAGNTHGHERQEPHGDMPTAGEGVQVDVRRAGQQTTAADEPTLKERAADLARQKGDQEAVPLPPAKPLLPPPMFAGKPLPPPISLGAPITPLWPTSPRGGAHPPAQSVPQPSLPVEVQGDTISDITHYH